MNIELSVSDVLYVGILAFILTWIIQNVAKLFKLVMVRPTQFNYHAKDFKQIVERCYNLFPRDILQYKGATLKRGMKVRLTTSQHKTFEGQLIGANNDNMVCVVTSQCIVAQELENVLDISVIE